MLTPFVFFEKLIDNLITRHHHHDPPPGKKKRVNFGVRLRKSIWFGAVALHTLMLLGLPLQVTFGVTDEVEFDAQGNETLESGTDAIETGLGLGAGLLMFNIVLKFFTNLMQLIPAGVICGTGNRKKRVDVFYRDR